MDIEIERHVCHFRFLIVFVAYGINNVCSELKRMEIIFCSDSTVWNQETDSLNLDVQVKVKVKLPLYFQCQ